ncbi:MAG: hypothetical protein ACR2GR_01005 [Rhodothermales bacterium]
MIYFLLDPVSSDEAISQLARVMTINKAWLRRGYRAFLLDVAAGNMPLWGRAVPVDYAELHPLQAALGRNLAAAHAGI